jgi:type IV pilus assembly protein PilY1
MRFENRRRRAGVIAGLVLLVSAIAGYPRTTALADDTVLFSTIVPPNVMLLVDNSGSMNGIVWHPAFDPSATPACAYWTNTNDFYSVEASSSDTFPDGASDTGFQSGSHAITSTGCVTTAREIFVDPLVEAKGEVTYWSGRYLNWYYSSAADTHVASITGTGNGTLSACVGGGSYDLYRRSRITAAQAILRQVICEVNTGGAVRFGLAQFRNGSNPNGGYVVVPAEDYLDSGGAPNVYSLSGNTQSHADHLDDAIDDLTGESYTPLGESLFQIYTYFMSRDLSDRPSRGGRTFPEYEYLPSDGSRNSSGAPTVPDSPVSNACQRNFVIVITDGEPSKDDFSTEGGGTDIGFGDFTTLIGDYNVDGEDELPTTAPDCSGGSSWDCGRYLDDIAKFMQEVDFRPDIPAYNGREQFIDVYTVGFTTNASANDLLLRTAQQGNGTFSTSNNPAQLAADIVDAINDILQKSQSFTAATVPATRTSEGGQFYTSLFVPSNNDGYWEGHLKSWTITASGEIRDTNDNCALNDPGAPASCFAGAFLSTAVPHWDAGTLLAARTAGSRDLRTTVIQSAGVNQMVSFESTVLTAAHMNLAAGDIASYDTTPYTAPTTADELRDVVVDNLRGCELGSVGSGCTERSWKLGDIFHANPVVVAGPASFRRDLDYRAFSNYYKQRKRVIVAGANDGFLRFFDAGTWQGAAVPPDYDNGTGAEMAGFMPYAVRQVAKGIPIDEGGRTLYGIDGSPSVADVWFYPNASVNAAQDGTDWQEWRTVAVGGLRQGGSAYYGLDLTDSSATSCTSPATGSGYPCYLWEFPREDATGGIVDYMGQTWSDATIVKVRVNPSVTSPTSSTPAYDRWVAVIGTGYHQESDPNSAGTYSVTSTRGRGIVMIDVMTGQVLAEKKFDPSATTGTTDPSTFVYSSTNPEQAMHYAFTASPAVFDLDFDGYADVVFMPDLGGNVWKWVIDEIGQDPINGSGSVAQPNWPFRKFFSAPVYTEAGPPARSVFKSMFFTPSAVLKNGNLWLVVGTGQRMDLKDPGITGTNNENNRLYTIVDSDPLDDGSPTAVVTEGDLSVLPPNTGCADISSYQGYYFIGEDGEKFITETDIFSFAVLAASYIPTVASDPCVSSGTAKLYAYKIYCGEGVFVDPGSGGTPSISVDLGSGMPTSPQITISSGGYTGSSSDPSPNKVIINNQDGEVVVPGSGDLDGDGSPDCPGPSCPCPNWPNDCPLPAGGGGISQFYWREL